MTTTYYKFIEPEPFKAQSYEKVGYEYRSFLLRVEYEYLFWKIEMLDGTEPPVDLRGSYTSQKAAKQAIDAFLAEEAIKQAASQKEAVSK